MRPAKLQSIFSFIACLWSAAILAIAGTASALAHSVSVGYVVNGANSITVYYGSYHSGVLPAEGIVRLVGPVTLTQAATNVVQSKPAGLIDGTNNFYAGSCSGGSLGTPVNWQSATFTACRTAPTRSS